MLPVPAWPGRKTLPHPPGEIGFRGFDEQVVVVVHQAIGVAAPAIAFHHLGQDLQEREAILVVQVDGLPGVSQEVKW